MKALLGRVVAGGAMLALIGLVAPALSSAASATGAGAHRRMHPRVGVKAASTAVTTSGLRFGGGNAGVGVTTATARVYLVFWGSQWGAESPAGSLQFANDPARAAIRLRDMYQGIGTNSEQWSGVMTQYCEGVPFGSASCPLSVAHVAYPLGGTLAGVWADTSAPTPTQATFTEIGNEAVKAAGHFGNTTSALNRQAQYIIASPSGTHPDGFNLTQNFCAWHDWNQDLGAATTNGNLAVTNMPYVLDLHQSCGQNFVNAGSAGTLDGVTIVAGHEYAETITDQFPAGGWLDSSGAENADICAWVTPGQPGGAGNIAFANGSFAMQGTWSNDTTRCDLTHPVIGNDFSIAASPTSVSVIAGQGFVGSITTATTIGSPQTITLSASGLPPGALVAFNPVTLTTGASSSFVIWTAAGTPAGTYPVSIKASGMNVRSATVNVTVTPAPVPALRNGQFLTNVSGAAGTDLFYALNVPASQTTIRFETLGGSGNVDVYAKLGSKPTTTSYDCRSIATGNTETCTISSTTPGTYYVLLHGTSIYSAVNVQGLYRSTSNQPLAFNTAVPNIADDMGRNQFWKITVPSGMTKLVFQTTGSNGDADLYVRRGSRPTTTDYKCRSNGSTDDETCTINLPGGGDWYVMVRGYAPYYGVSLIGYWS
ncbi:MAG TPA: PPC domain-containing protein [Acidimicrobiia bacterium]|nr:PPC domain-containing protein [Acidimicrobiia bacterium]